MVKLEATSTKDRVMQTRSYETSNDLEVFSAALATMQDLGFSVDLTHRDLGVITVSKSRDARETMEQIGVFFLALFDSRALLTAAHTQTIRGTIIVVPKNKQVVVRLTLQRVIYNMQGQVLKVEAIKDESIYQDFFDKLSKGIFLEGNL